MHKNLPTVEGLKTRFLCSISADESTNTTLAGYVKVGGESLPMTAVGENELVAPATPAGDYLYELRAGGAVVLWGHLCARPSAFPAVEDATAIEVAATITGEAAVAVSITLKEGPPGPKGDTGATGPQGPKGDTGETGPQGAPLTYADLTEAQKAELVAGLEKETVTVTPSGTTEDNANAYGFGCFMSRSGQVRELAVECRENGAALPIATEAWVKIWRGDTQLLAVSTNSQVHELAGVLRYSFPPFEVQAGEELRVTFHAAADLEGNSYQPGLRCCLRASLLESGKGGGMLGADGGYINTEWTAKYAWQMMAVKYAPAEHVNATTAHLTAAEHEGLAELLAHKDALLALLSADA